MPARHRHRHSPRIRRRARDWGVDPDTVRGTGPAGRVTEDDLRQEAEAPSPAELPPVGMPAAATARCAVIAGDRERLVAGALVAAVAALRQAGRPVTRGAITRDGRTRSLADAHDLTPDGVLRRWPQADEGPGEVRIVDAAGVDALTAPPLVGEVAVVALGAVRSELMVDPGAARPTFVLGRALTVTAVTGPGLGESVSTALVAAIRRQLEST